MDPDNPCKPCSRDKEFVMASMWCCDCEEHLCRDCSKAHKKNKLSQNHSVVDDSIVSSLPNGLVRAIQLCKNHPKFNLDVICTNHDHVCCRVCMLSEHRNCKFVLPIESASEFVHDSKLFEQLSNEGKQVEQTIDDIVQFGKKNVERVDAQEVDTLKAIDFIRTAFLTKLENVKQKLMDKLQNNVDDNQSQIQAYQEEIKRQKDAAIIYQQEMDFIRNHASENKAFLLVERLKGDLSKDKKTMTNTSRKIENIAMSFYDSSNFSIKSLGRILLENQACPIKYTPLSQVLLKPIVYSDITQQQPEQHNPHHEEEEEILETVYEDLEDMKDIRPIEPSYVKSTGPYFTLSKTELKFDRKLKSRSNKIKQMWQGTFQKTIQVAITCLKDGGNSVDIHRLLDTRNDNILNFYGAFMDKKQVGLVFEYVHHGNMPHYLQTDEGTKLHQTELLSIAAQIARGMAYLESRNIVHTKLQGSKILVGENGEVKVSGLEYGTIEKVIAKFSFESKNEDELSFNQNEVIKITDKPEANWWEGEINGKSGFLPVNYVYPPQTYVKSLDENLFRWYAIETLQSGRCDIRSNVWSFGIVMTELFNHGQTPYHGIDNKEILSKTKHGYRHPKPTACPDALYKIMLQCWDETPDNRPAFDNLYHTVEDLLYDL